MKSENELRKIMAQVIDVFQSHDLNPDEIEMILITLKKACDHIKAIEHAEREAQCLSTIIH